MQPKGPFNLLHQNQYFNGWPTLKSDPQTIIMAFPVEGWQESAAVSLKQLSDGSLDINVYGASDELKAKSQALAALSLDEDGSGWPKVGKRDKLIHELQEKYQYMRPTLFHSAYEAAAAFIIGHRISIAQARKIRAVIAEELGEKISIGSEGFYAFPSPQKLLTIQSYKGLNEIKIERLHAVAQAALDGILDRKHLRSLDETSALTELETLPGIGPFFSQGILYRGVGVRNGITEDNMSIEAVRIAYSMPNAAKDEIVKITENWSPYRMWAMVLLHVWMRETNSFKKMKR